MIRALIGDCRDLLPTLPDASVHCVVTSPPYWGLRDYGIDAQLGLEPDFNAYVTAMVGVFREVRRVLRDDGTLWLNLGDSYAGSTMTGGNNGINASGGEQGFKQQRQFDRKNSAVGLKPKDLCGIPWRVAFALQADGWYLRQDIIWSKPNPMPESVTDRCTKGHEYLFLLSKRERYYYDADAIKENGSFNTHTTRKDGESSPIRLEYTKQPNNNGQSGLGAVDINGTRNKRSVWEVTTQPFAEAHFATFPPALIEPCIKAGTSEKGCCGKCGKPWVRQTSHSYIDKGKGIIGGQKGCDPSNGWTGYPSLSKQTETLGWSPACTCAAEVVPCTVLDPFGGAGTTGLVADRLQRNAILIELNPTYAAMGERRITDDAPLFVVVASTGQWAEMWAKPFDFSQEPKGNPD